MNVHKLWTETLCVSLDLSIHAACETFAYPATNLQFLNLKLRDVICMFQEAWSSNVLWPLEASQMNAFPSLETDAIWKINVECEVFKFRTKKVLGGHGLT